MKESQPLGEDVQDSFVGQFLLRKKTVPLPPAISSCSSSKNTKKSLKSRPTINVDGFRSLKLRSFTMLCFELVDESEEKRENCFSFEFLCTSIEHFNLLINFRTSESSPGLVLCCCSERHGNQRVLARWRRSEMT